VAYKPRESHVNDLPKLETKALSILKRALVLIGKPIYLLIFFIIKSLSISVTYLRKIRFPMFQYPQLNIKFKLLSIRKPIVKLPKIKLLRPKFKVTKLTLTPFVVTILCLLSFYYIYYQLPSASELSTRNIEVSTKIYDRNGILLYQIYKNKNRSIISLGDVPKNVINATLAAEDAEFYSHPGISIRGIIRATFNNLKDGKLTGGSTITQQLVKNALLTPEKTISRKLKEIILAIKVEATFSKDQILEMYLNEVPYGGTAYGISEASRIFFGKEVKDLNIGEAALLAGLPKSPSRFSPFGQNPDLTFERQREVIKLMRINKYITKDEEAEALNTPITFATQKTNILAPHFVMYVKEILEEKFGKEMVESGGLNVKTTLDINIQKLAEGAVTTELEKLKGLNVSNAGVVVINPQTGEILAMVGSKNYFDIKGGGNVNTTVSLRPPGSSIKIVNYAYALSHGYTPISILDDSPITFNVRGQDPYSPKNYDSKYRGKITLRSALAESRNIPAVKVLNSYGVDKMIEQGKKMGISTWNDPTRFGLSLTLGGGEVKLIDMAKVYGTIANYGNKPDVSPFILVTDYKGKTIEVNPCTENIKVSTEVGSLINNFAPKLEITAKEKEVCRQEKVLDPRVAYLLTDILKDNLARSPAFGRFSQLIIGNHPEVAVKTGTSNSLRDNLTIGYNQNYLVAVWVGNNDNSPMSRVASGVTGASPIWNTIMTKLTKDEIGYDWKIPEGIVSLPICRYTGTLSCSGCSTNMEWFLEENAPKVACNPEFIEKLRQEKEKKIGEILEPAVSVEN
jgi:membrane peptidoglycan carboxypeptidase